MSKQEKTTISSTTAVASVDNNNVDNNNSKDHVAVAIIPAPEEELPIAASLSSSRAPFSNASKETTVNKPWLSLR
jgi:hypothetical protein